MSIKVRESINNLQTYNVGGRSDLSSDWECFDWNESEFPPSNKVFEVMKSFYRYERYPDITAKELKVSKYNNKIKIEKEGLIQKAVTKVDEITFSPKIQEQVNQEILIITERCVFEIKNNMVHLIEVSPGIDIENDIIKQMEFKPVISPSLI